MHEINGTGRSHNPAEASNGARVAISSQGTHTGERIFGRSESEREALTPSTTTPLPNNLAGLQRPTPTGCTTRRTESYTRNQVYVSLPTPRARERERERFARTSINKPAKYKARADRRRWAARERRYNESLPVAFARYLLLRAGTSKKEKGSIDDEIGSESICKRDATIFGPVVPLSDRAIVRTTQVAICGTIITVPLP